MPDLKQLGAVLTWFTGVIAGVTALLYGMGFIATVFHFNHLRIDTQFVTKDGFVYVGRGGMALFRAAPYLIAGAFFGLVLTWIVDLAGWLLRRVAKGPPGASEGEGPRRTHISAYLYLVLAIAVTLGLLQSEITPALGATDLGPLASCASDPGRCAPLVHRFGMVVIWVGFILMICWRGGDQLPPEAPGRRFVLPMFGITILFAVGFLVPVPYGLFVVPAAMSPVQLSAADACRFELGGLQQINLVQQDADGVVLWLNGRRDFRWIAAGQLHTLHLGPPMPQAPCPPPAH